MKIKFDKFLCPPIGHIVWGFFMIIWNILFIAFDLYFAVDYSLKGKVGSALLFGVFTCFMIHYLRVWIIRTHTMIKLRRLSKEFVKMFEKFLKESAVDIPHEEVKE